MTFQTSLFIVSFTIVENHGTILAYIIAAVNSRSLTSLSPFQSHEINKTNKQMDKHTQLGMLL